MPATALAADSVTRRSFADGTWNGYGRLRQAIEGTTINGMGAFSMKVRAGRVSGTISLIGTISGKLENTRATAELSGRYPLTGKASAPTGRGLLRGSTVVKGKRTTGTAPVVVALTWLRGTCDRMTGRIVIRPAKPDPNATGPQSIATPFTASRVGGSGPRC